MAWPPACCSRPWRSSGPEPRPPDKHRPPKGYEVNLDEAAYWVNSLFPAKLEFHRVDDFHIGCADLGQEQQLACTADFGRVDTGLTTTENGLDFEVRSELFTIGKVTERQAAGVLGAAAGYLRSAAGKTPAQPGVLLPSVNILAGLGPEFTVHHGLLSVPYVWGPEVPRLTEQAGDVNGENTGARGRLTVMLQLIMLTDAERDYAAAYGIGELQQELARNDVDLLDWRR